MVEKGAETREDLWEAPQVQQHRETAERAVVAPRQDPRQRGLVYRQQCRVDCCDHTAHAPPSPASHRVCCWRRAVHESGQLPAQTRAGAWEWHVPGHLVLRVACFRVCACVHRFSRALCAVVRTHLAKQGAKTVCLCRLCFVCFLHL